MYYEVDDGIGVFARGEDAENVADDFHDAGEGEGEEVPGVALEEGEGVEEGGEKEEDDGEDSEGEGGSVAVVGKVSRMYEGNGWVARGAAERRTHR